LGASRRSQLGRDVATTRWKGTCVESPDLEARREKGNVQKTNLKGRARGAGAAYGAKIQRQRCPRRAKKAGRGGVLEGMSVPKSRRVAGIKLSHSTVRTWGGGWKKTCGSIYQVCKRERKREGPARRGGCRNITKHPTWFKFGTVPTKGKGLRANSEWEPGRPAIGSKQMVTIAQGDTMISGDSAS